MSDATAATAPLKVWGAGDEGASRRCCPTSRLNCGGSRAYMARERVGHTLHTTALVNEPYLRLVDAWALATDAIHR